MTTFIEILKQKQGEALLLGQLKSAYETTPGDERSTMLLAKDDYAFRVACAKGHLELAKWFWSECKTPDEQLTIGITTHLATGKVAIDQNLTASDQNLTLKPRSVTEFPGFSDDNNRYRDTKRDREEQGDNKGGKQVLK